MVLGTYANSVDPVQTPLNTASVRRLLCLFTGISVHNSVVVVVLLFYILGKHLRSCRDGQLT